MNIFASKTPRDLNRDPRPWLNYHGNRQKWASGAGYCTECATLHDPRPEFDHVQHNEPNPILVEFRATCVDQADAEGWREAFSVARVDPGDWSLPTSIYDGTDEQFEHAYRVLQRVSRLHGGAA